MQTLGTITMDTAVEQLTDRNRFISNASVINENFQTLYGDAQNGSLAGFSHEGTTVTGSDFISAMNYLWENYSNYSILSSYLLIKDYEKMYPFNSEELLKRWKEGKLIFDSNINDWLSTYLRIKNHIDES